MSLFTDEQKKKLSEPISVDAFCGAYLKVDRSAFRPLRNGFNVAQTSLRKLSQNPVGNELELLQEENQKNWNDLAESLVDTFTSSSRDIELIGWFISSQILSDHSGKGFSNAFEWLSFLIGEHWDSLNPVLPANKLKSILSDEQLAEQADAKFKAFSQLVGDNEESSLLYAPFLMYPLAEDITFFQYQSAERKGELASLKAVRKNFATQDHGPVEARLGCFQSALNSISNIQQELNQLAKKYSLTAPNLRFISKLIQGVCNAITFLTGVELKREIFDSNLEESNAQAPKVDAEQQNNGVQKSSEVLGNVMQSSSLSSQFQDLTQTATLNSSNRNIAFHQLREIANYFRRSEPHSPVSFLLEKAIRWGSMSLPELLTEMVSEPDGDLLKRIFNTTGLDNEEQIKLPRVAKSASSVDQVSGAIKKDLTRSKVSPEMSVSDVNSADALLNKIPKKLTSTGSTALRW